jgi:methylenetetrahydrofolate dehydrogenase (NADP+)/methenyltetrahydrofolate cyclohydrolase
MDGRALALEVKTQLRQEVERLKAGGVEPALATILVGDNPASKMYLETKHKAARDVGIKSVNHNLGSATSYDELAALIASLNSDDDVHGILLQLPLPSHLNSVAALAEISPDKDVDGLTPSNVNKLFYNQASLVPCTAKGIMALLHRYSVPLRGAHVVVINRSMLVGRPLYQLLLSEDATVTVCHSKTRELARLTREADVVVTAVGKRPGFALTADMVKEGAVVIDVAINRVDGKVMGDADPSVAERASYITPVPGGVGPMTVTMLLENTIIATRNLTEPTRSIEVAL